MVTVDSGQSQHRLPFDCGEGCLAKIPISQIQTVENEDRFGAPKADGLGSPHISAAHAVSNLRKQVTQTVQVIALDFQHILLDRAAGPAGGLELAQ
jgi:hypothetical protein